MSATSAFGHWSEDGGLPVFVYTADQRRHPDARWKQYVGLPGRLGTTTRHFALLGNQRIQLYADNDGGLALFDESEGTRWLTAPGRKPTGLSTLSEDGQRPWGSGVRQWPASVVPERVFGGNSFTIRMAHRGLALERTVLCPAGDVPWVLIRVRLHSATNRVVEHTESWDVRPRHMNLGSISWVRDRQARRFIRYSVERGRTRLRAIEHRSPQAARTRSPLARLPVPLATLDPDLAQIFGSPTTLVLESLGQAPRRVRGDSGTTPCLQISHDVHLDAGEPVDLWFRFGVDDGSSISDPAALFEQSLQELSDQVPRARARQAPQAEREIPWHGALLRGGVCTDAVIGGATLDQGSAYSLEMGFNGAARDPLQHALPLVYTDPALALAVLRNTCAWATPDGDMPYALDGAKAPNRMLQPSDGNLYALWLASEYAAGTGDLAAFDELLAYHPSYEASAVTVREHLRRQFRFFVDEIGTGENGHVRMRNADWNDSAVQDSGVPRRLMIAEGESVLNSGFAAWVLGVFSGLCARLGDDHMAMEAHDRSDALRAKVAEAWNGHWFDRAYAPGGTVVGGPERMWLECQPWALLCGSVDDDTARQLLATIDAGARAGSPLGTRLLWPLPTERSAVHQVGDGTRGGIWYYVNTTLIWAASRYDIDLAWDEWRRMSLHAHTSAYPHVWEGTISGPDSYNAPESARPGRTWESLRFGGGMQVFPVHNAHSHAQPLLAYLRLIGVEPTRSGSLEIGKGAAWNSAVLRVDEDGHGRLLARGPVTLDTEFGQVRGGPGWVEW